MDYKKKYDDAMARLELAVRTGMKLDPTYIFPELAESEDERIREDIMEAVENWHPYGRVEDIRAYLEKQKEQKPAEWSEEDEEMLDAMIDIVSNSLYEPLCPREGMLAWLESPPLRCPKSSDNWKPSKEQMEALYEAAQDAAIDRESGNALYELYEQLKKL